MSVDAAGFPDRGGPLQANEIDRAVTEFDTGASEVPAANGLGFTLLRLVAEAKATIGSAVQFADGIGGREAWARTVIRPVAESIGFGTSLRRDRRVECVAMCRQEPREERPAITRIAHGGRLAPGSSLHSPRCHPRTIWRPAIGLAAADNGSRLRPAARVGGSSLQPRRADSA